MKKLEESIQKNREEFDYRRPHDTLWQGVNKALFRSEKVSLWNVIWVWRAAALVFFCLSVAMYSFNFWLPGTKLRAGSIQLEFSDQESFYRDQIAQKVALVDAFTQGVEVDDAFAPDFQKLDAMYQVLREEMKNRPSEKVKDALILNLLVRIDLLNQQIKKLEDNKTNGSQSDQEI
jgi:hypothetical protein